MNKNGLIVTAILMALYDVFLHVCDAFRYFRKTDWPYPPGPGHLMMWIGGTGNDYNADKQQAVYQLFWISYYGLVALLLVIYLI
jgi:hypothetical protein